MAGTTLYRVISPARYVDPWGHVTDNLGKYVRVTEVIETFENGEFKLLDNGYGTPDSVWETPVLESNDGRTWAYVADRVSFHGGGRYVPLFSEPRDPELERHQVGPSVAYVTAKRLESLCCVDLDGQPVMLEEIL